MFQRILVPVDLTDRHGRTLEIAGSLAAPGQGKVTLLHVVEVIPDFDPDQERAFYDRLQTKAREKMAALGNALQVAGVTYASEVVFGSRGPEILSWASEHQVDLIALTSHRVTPDRPSEGWSTFSYQLGILAPCPVLLVK